MCTSVYPMSCSRCCGFSWVDVICHWCPSWVVALNYLYYPSKTQFIWLGGDRQLGDIGLHQRRAEAFPYIVFSSTDSDLGVTLEQGLLLGPYCSLPSGIIGHLDRVFQSAAWLIGHIHIYVPVSAYMRAILPWLAASQSIAGLQHS